MQFRVYQFFVNFFFRALDFALTSLFYVSSQWKTSRPEKKTVFELTQFFQHKRFVIVRKSCNLTSISRMWALHTTKLITIKTSETKEFVLINIHSNNLWSLNFCQRVLLLICNYFKWVPLVCEVWRFQTVLGS